MDLNISNNKKENWAASLIALMSFAIAMFQAKQLSLAFDDPFSTFYSQFDPTQLIPFMNKGNNPIGYELFLHYWTKVFGRTEISLRFPSIIAGAISVFMVCKTGWRFFHPLTGVLAAFLLSLSAFFLQFQLEVRGYSIAIMLTMIYLNGLISLFYSSVKLSLILQLIISGTLLLYFHYFGIFPVCIAGLFLFLTKPDKRGIILTFILLVIGVLFIPQAIALSERVKVVASTGTWLELTNSFFPVYQLFMSFTNQTEANFYFYTLLFVVFLIKLIYINKNNLFTKSALFVAWCYLTIFIYSFRNDYNAFFGNGWNQNQGPIAAALLSLFFPIIVWYWRILKSPNENTSSRLSWALLMFAGFSLCLVFLLSWKFRIFLDRYFFFIVPIFFLVLSEAIRRLLKNYFAWIGGGLILFMMLSLDLTGYHPRNEKGILNEIKQFKNNTTVVLVKPNLMLLNLTYYLYEDLQLKAVKINNLEKAEDTLTQLLKLKSIYYLSCDTSVKLPSVGFPSPSRIILLSNDNDYLGCWENNMGQQYALVKEFTYHNNIRVRYYQRSSIH